MNHSLDSLNFQQQTAPVFIELDGLMVHVYSLLTAFIPYPKIYRGVAIFAKGQHNNCQFFCFKSGYSLFLQSTREFLVIYYQSISISVFYHCVQSLH